MHVARRRVAELRRTSTRTPLLGPRAARSGWVTEYNWTLYSLSQDTELPLRSVHGRAGGAVRCGRAPGPRVHRPERRVHHRGSTDLGAGTEPGAAGGRRAPHPPPDGLRPVGDDEDWALHDRPARREPPNPLRRVRPAPRVPVPGLRAGVRRRARDVRRREGRAREGEGRRLVPAVLGLAGLRLGFLVRRARGWSPMIALARGVGAGLPGGRRAARPRDRPHRSIDGRNRGRSTSSASRGRTGRRRTGRPRHRDRGGLGSPRRSSRPTVARDDRRCGSRTRPAERDGVHLRAHRGRALGRRGDAGLVLGGGAAARRLRLGFTGAQVVRPVRN